MSDLERRVKSLEDVLQAAVVGAVAGAVLVILIIVFG
jgi:hypothetical protein